MSTDVHERERTTRTDDGAGDRFAHIIFTPGRDAGAVITEARVTGTPVTALCGKRWIPQHDPKRFPVCPRCKAIREGTA